MSPLQYLQANEYNLLMGGFEEDYCGRQITQGMTRFKPNNYRTESGEKGYLYTRVCWNNFWVMLTVTDVGYLCLLLKNLPRLNHVKYASHIYFLLWNWLIFLSNLFCPSINNWNCSNAFKGTVNFWIVLRRLSLDSPIARRSSEKNPVSRMENPHSRKHIF